MKFLLYCIHIQNDCRGATNDLAITFLDLFVLPYFTFSQRSTALLNLLKSHYRDLELHLVDLVSLFIKSFPF